jgi:MFS family permease
LNIANFLKSRFTGLWRHADFMRLWSGQTISVFGSMVGGTAMTFTALLFLHATPFQMALLQFMELFPAFLAGLFAGAWVDRLQRRPLLIGADIGRAVVLASIPITAALGLLHIEQIYLVALLSILRIVFDLAYQSYLPALVGHENVVEGNSKLSASAAVSEFGGFSIGGWLVQIFTAPFAILIDAFSFLVSAFSVYVIKAREPVIAAEEHPNMRREISAGLKTVFHHPLLRASAMGILFVGISQGIFGSLVVLYMARGLGFNPGILGMIWAVGGVSSLFGASLTPRIARRLGEGPAMILGLFVGSISAFFIPLASGATLLSAAFLILAQLGDGFYVLYEINTLSFRQEITSERMLGRVNATMQFIALGAALFGTFFGGLLGESIGVRQTLLLGSCITLFAAFLIAFSPLRKLKSAVQPMTDEL